MNKYDKIINMPHFEPKKHRRASKEERASQFGAFRALTGLEDANEEAARLTESFCDLGESMSEILNRRFILLQNEIREKPFVTVTHFVPDDKKTGGKYVKTSGNLKRIDSIAGKIIFCDRKEIFIDNIRDIECDIFDEI